MWDMFSYLDEYGGYTFTEKALCEVDALVLSQLTYYVFDGIAPGINDSKPPVELIRLPSLMNKDNFICVGWDTENSKKLFEKIVNSRRFRSTRICDYVNEVDKEKDMQFCAMVFLLGNGDIFVAFRGTDDELVGWKEDFCMAYRTPIASQERSVSYVDEIMRSLIKRRKAHFYFGGHSKGGNLAVYAAMNSKKQIQRRIARVYNMDGPGFRPEFMESFSYDVIKEKTIKIIPGKSFVGMLMQPDDDYVLIDSNEVGILQHIPLSWQVAGDKFVRAKSQQDERKKLYERINSWLLGIDKDKIGNFLQIMFETVEMTQAETLSELTEERWKKSGSIVHAYKYMDDEMKNIFWELIGFLMELRVKDQHERIKRWKIIAKLRERIEIK